MDATNDDRANDELHVRSYLRDGTPVVEAVGFMTMGNLDTFAAALRPDGPGAARLTVDLRQVEFLDGSGLALLAQVSKRLRSPETPCVPRVLVTPGRQPERVLHIGGFGAILDIAHDFKDA